MSRLKKLKEKSKQKIKSTIIGLALTIFIGATGALGSYAWFINSNSVENNLSVKTGSLDVEIREGIMKTTSNDSNDDKSKIYHQYFSIYNTGTLDQVVNLKLIDKSSNKDYSKEIDYKLYSVDGNVEKLLIAGKLDELNGKTLEANLYLESDNKENGDNKSKNFKAEIIVPKPKRGLWYEKKITFKLIAEAVQANASELQGGTK